FQPEGRLAQRGPELDAPDQHEVGSSDLDASTVRTWAGGGVPLADAADTLPFAGRRQVVHQVEELTEAARGDSGKLVAGERQERSTVKLLTERRKLIDLARKRLVACCHHTRPDACQDAAPVCQDQRPAGSNLRPANRIARGVIGVDRDAS